VAFDTFAVPREDLERALSAALAGPVRLTGLRRLAGGMIGSVLLADLDRDPGEVVVKLSERADAFRGEAETLDWLARHTGLPVPKVLGSLSDGKIAPFGLLALARLPGVNLGEARALGGSFETLERDMAEAVASLHAHAREEFGAVLGGRRHATWVEAFRERLGNVARNETCRTRLDADTIRRVEQIADRLDDILARLPDGRTGEAPARLVHGDIWATNVIVRPDPAGGWRLSGFVDPAAEFADVEYELAYLLVFDTVGRAFFERYRDFFAIDEGFETRRHVYHLHTMLVHVRCFGDERYRAAAHSLARRVAAEAGLE